MACLWIMCSIPINTTAVRSNLYTEHPTYTIPWNRGKFSFSLVFSYWHCSTSHTLTNWTNRERDEIRQSNQPRIFFHFVGFSPNCYGCAFAHTQDSIYSMFRWVRVCSLCALFLLAYQINVYFFLLVRMSHRLLFFSTLCMPHKQTILFYITSFFHVGSQIRECIAC